MGKSRYVQFITPQSWPYWTGSLGHRWPTGSSDTQAFSVTGKQNLVTSQGNPFHLLGRSNRKIGGDFLAIKHEFWDNPIPPREYSNHPNPSQPNTAHYFGPIKAAGNGVIGVNGFPSPIIPSDSSLDALGTTAIANVLPTNPLSGLFVSLGELKREGIPSLLGVASWKNRTRVARAAGDEYLGYQFGWLPLVNDLKRFSHSVTSSDELIAQYDRNSGRRIKRTYKFPIDRTYSKSTGTGFPVPAVSGIFSNSPDYQSYYTESTQTIERWFEGCFTYYLPPYKPNGDNSKRNAQLRNYLYGTRVTPEGIWDLTPWTWAADWVGNFGDVLHNVSAFQNDGLTMLYGYIMTKTVNEVTRTQPNMRFDSYAGGQYSASWTMRTTVKKRRSATPYGFGLNPGSFSDRQWSILAALGLSRGSRQLYS